jgi:hypothetical protein
MNVIVGKNLRSAATSRQMGEILLQCCPSRLRFAEFAATYMEIALCLGSKFPLAARRSSQIFARDDA